ncbi:trace amine-associated receptor 13c-like [Anneissia japonica]|uniref:trace amine-associated receptor 13c-like n=1 Tax=Anneissia japonica TaxID=1529436 RepID=UPI001425B0C8|nr:trace amine-associated receptor 13c-like [Anneissia japonica]
MEGNIENNTDFTSICVFPKTLSFPFGFVTLCIMIGNVFVIVSVIRIRSLRQPCYLILASMALVDVLTGIIGIVVVLRLALHGRFLYLGETVGWILQKMMVWSISLSFFHHLYLVAERYFAIMHPYMYIVKVHTRSVVMFLIVTWTIGLLYFAIIISPLYNEDMYNESNFIFKISIIIPTYACHLRIYCEAKRKARQVVSSSTSQAVQPKRSDFKAARVTTIILGGFSICILPSLFHNIAFLTQGEKTRCTLSYFLSFLSIYIDSMLNPVVYGICNKTFRDSYKNMFHKIICK